MSSTATRPAPALDLTSIREVRRTWHEDRQLYWVELVYHGTQDYDVAGFSDGSGAVCCNACPQWLYRRTCKHANALPLFLDELAKREQAAKDTPTLLENLAFWQRQDTLSPDQRRAVNAINAVLLSRGVRPDAARVGFLVARGDTAKAELFG